MLECDDDYDVHSTNGIPRYRCESCDDVTDYVNEIGIEYLHTVPGDDRYKNLKYVATYGDIVNFTVFTDTGNKYVLSDDNCKYCFKWLVKNRLLIKNK
jgi:hypothetical protein